MKRRYDASMVAGGEDQYFSHFMSGTLIDRVMRPRDVPGRILNMALLNMGTTDSCLRVDAHNLLCSLARRFNFRIRQQLASARGKYQAV